MVCTATRVSLLTLDGVALPGRTAASSFEIGAPVSVSVAQSTTSVPPGTSSVTTSLTVSNQISTGVVTPAKFGDILAFYSAANAFGLPDNVDGTVFVIENTSAQAITNGIFTINSPGGPADSFNVGTIPAGGQAIIEPGISDDGGTNHTFFAYTGNPRDESDDGPNSDNTQFDFKASQGVYFMDSGVFTPAATKGPSVSDPNTILNFLGGPNDAPAHDFAPQVVANLFGTFQQPPGLTVEVAYADNIRVNPFFPSPWNGSPNTIFVGGGPSFDAGALRIINDGTSPVTINDVTITLFGGQKFDLWGSNTIPAGGNLILTQTNSYNLDSSDYGVLGFPQAYPDGETAHAARVDVTVNGQVVTLLDTGHVLTTGGSDLAAGGANESQNWRPIGTTGITNPGGSGVQVVVTDNLPASGFVVNPTSISPTASTVSSTQVVWTPTPLTESVPTTFQLTGAIVAIAPGEVRQISTGSSVVATTFAADGTPIQTTLPFGPLVVAADHIISLAPATHSIDKGGKSTYMVTLSNPLTTSQTYTLSTQGLDGFSTQLAATVTIGPGQTVNTPLTLSAPIAIGEGIHGFVVIAQTSAGGQDSAEGEITVSPTVVLPTENISVILSPTSVVAGLRMPTTFSVTLTNTGDVSTTYNLSGLFPAGFVGTFAPSTVTVPPGLGNSRTVLLRLAQPADSTPGPITFQVIATSTTDPTVKGSADGVETVVQNGVNVMLSPQTGSPGDTFTMTVKNVGTVTDTYDLTLAGPVGMVSRIAQSKVTLAPGSSQNVTITTSAITFASPGPLDLTAVATSEGNPAVIGAASSALTIAGSQGLTASLTPAVQLLPIPGTTSFLLIVNNTGNLEDSYTARIIGTNGPVEANLLGLAGQTTQTVPLFRLPGLSTAAIVIQANLLGLGQGSVSVQVTSLSNPTRSVTMTATVTARDNSVADTKIQLIPSANPVIYGQTETVTATLTTGNNGVLPTGNLVFYVDGIAQTPVPIQTANGVTQAVITLNGLSVGLHQIQAFYAGNANIAATNTSVLSLTVVSLAVGDGPQVTKIQRFGYHALPTTYVITFDESLDRSRALDTSNYRIVGPGGAVVPIHSAIYDDATRTVTLVPSHQLNIHWLYQLTIIGVGSSGLSNVSGQLLDGTHTGRPGSNFISVLKASDLILGASVPGGPSRLAMIRHQLAEIVANQARQLAKQHHLSTQETIHKNHVAPVHKVVLHAPKSHIKFGNSAFKPIRAKSAAPLTSARSPVVINLPSTHRSSAKTVGHMIHSLGRQKSK